MSVKQENSTDDQSDSQKLTPSFSLSSLLFSFDEENDDSLVEPRYLPYSLKWSILNKDQLENTVFKTFSNSSEIIEVYILLLIFFIFFFIYRNLIYLFLSHC